ncbi:FAD/NAD(P)-binding protein [Glarea lozoyensis ATCC 20868]|uniref:FAD/NAD(P)-binding protein n=1 Tax=Glarea lozoyensis (strain ATCC 20868 / MF5171) TaxID=1116229 RepID=S3DPP7_GLAL2|nr:FAD/NAD(P)-binding protein [Glarea lozoyensis ATCC 20868]EPE28433.1 FAD/NAD(P)-binding protein [Glarea lozoyensis ATCC 20868]
MKDTRPFPVDGSTQSYWQYEGQHNGLPEKLKQNNIDFPDICDVAIVGGGYAGIATAYHLLKSTSPPPRVVLLEGREPCLGATGRNGGHLRPDYFMAAAKSSERYGAAAASEVVQFEVNHLSAIKSLIESEDIDCDFNETVSLCVFTKPEQAVFAREVYDKLQQEPSFDEALLNRVDFYTGVDAPHRTGVIEAKGYFSTPAAHFSPYKLFTALLACCMDLGLCLRTSTTVESVEKSKGDDHILTTLLGDTLSAKKVVIAANAYTSALLPEYTTAIVPCKGLVCHITGPEDRVLSKLPASSFAIMEQDPISNATGYNYMLQLADNSIVVGGAHHKYDTNDLGSWYHNFDDTQLITPAQSYFEDKFMQRSFIGWEDSQAHVDRVWTGIMGYSTDSLPHVGEVPDRQGVFVIAGFHGHGMPVIFLAAKGVAALIDQGTPYNKTGLPSIFKISRDRLETQLNDILAGRGIVSNKKLI